MSSLPLSRVQRVFHEATTHPRTLVETNDELIAAPDDLKSGNYKRQIRTDTAPSQGSKFGVPQEFNGPHAQLFRDP